MNDEQQSNPAVARVIQIPVKTQKALEEASDKLTVKQLRFIEEYFNNGGNGMRAALVAYDTTDENTARAMASENLAKPNIKELLATHKQAIMDRQNITLERAIEPIAMALDAKVIVKVKDENGNAKEVEIVDIDTRLKGSDRALKLLGITTDHDGKPGNIFNFVNLSAQQKEKYGI